LTRGNLSARHADCARLVDEPGKKGWQELDGSQRGQVHPGSIWQDAVRARPSSRERTWPLSFLGCRIAAGPCRSQSRVDGKMGVECPKKGAKWRLLREPATLLIMTQLLCCHAVALIVVEKSTERQLATTIYSSRTCVESLGSQIFKKAQKRSIPWYIMHAKRTRCRVAERGAGYGRWQVASGE
jgi:hypothetical protein